MEEVGRYLYRGISEETHGRNEGLQPKGTSFCRGIVIGEREDGGSDVVIGSGETLGDSEENAVIAHQRDSDAFSSSGVSTTPFLKRAKIYATHKNLRSRGIVYKIDRELLANNHIKEYRVKERTPYPEIPEDDEVILVSKNNGTLANEIVVEIITAGLNL
ncbi:MAG: hypothetical protein KAQ85_05675 [Thermodesulfovibrionia bacterium]|nr:hypothetical protein [Thermodesulfovibrionia bacterium]MCK5421135.1 hypothetical protein [Deltaproteobacteria bacterium]